MMIRINLLPTRQKKTAQAGRQFLVLLVAALLLTGIGNFLWYNSRDTERMAMRDQVAKIRSEIAALDKVIGEVNNLKAKRDEVNAKLAKLEELRRARNGPVRMLDALATVIPKKAWVLDFAEDKGTVKLSGMAESHDDVADFMKALATVVWTPKGMARVIERKRDATNARVELLTGEGAVEEFPIADIGYFFGGVELKDSSSAAGGAKGAADRKVVKFEIAMAANYKI